MAEKGMKNVPLTLSSPWQRWLNSSLHESIQRAAAFAALTEFYIFGKLASIRVECITMECEVVKKGDGQVDGRGRSDGGSNVGRILSITFSGRLKLVAVASVFAVMAAVVGCRGGYGGGRSGEGVGEWGGNW
jgi:hypothetical protein